MQIVGELVCFCPDPHNEYKKVAAGGKFSSFIIDSWFMNFSSVFKKSRFTTLNQTVKNTCRYLKSHKHKLCQPRSVHGVSVMWCVLEYLTIFTVNNLGCAHLLSAKENLKVFSRGKWGIKMLEETPDILSIFNAPKRL